MTCKKMFLLGVGHTNWHIFGAFPRATQSIVFSISGPPERPSFAKQISWWVGSHQSTKARIKNKLGKVNVPGEAWHLWVHLGMKVVSQLNGSFNYCSRDGSLKHQKYGFYSQQLAFRIKE